MLPFYLQPQLDHTQKLLVIAGTLCAGYLVCTPSHAGNMYVFKDNGGNVLLTNVVKGNKPKGKQFSKYDKKVRVTWYKDTNVHAYKNWGKSESSVLPKYSRNKSRFDHLIAKSAGRHGVDPALMKAVMHTESGFNPRARSPVGAQGLMQLMPATAKRFRVSNAWDPAQNIEGAAKYLKYLHKRFKGNKSLMLAGYNAGEGNVAKYKGIPPFKETQNYVVRVMSRYAKLYKNHFTVGTKRHRGVNLARKVAYNPIQVYEKNNTKYLKTTTNYMQASYKPLYSDKNVRRNNNVKRGSSMGNGSVPDNQYNASAFAALKNKSKK